MSLLAAFVLLGFSGTSAAAVRPPNSTACLTYQRATVLAVNQLRPALPLTAGLAHQRVRNALFLLEEARARARC